MALNPLNAELNPICHLLTLFGAHHIFHVSRIRVNMIHIKMTLYYMYTCTAGFQTMRLSFATKITKIVLSEI